MRRTSIEICWTSYACPSGYDDVIKWKLFPRYWPFVMRIHQSPVDSPHKGQWRHLTHYNVTVLKHSDWGTRYSSTTTNYGFNLHCTTGFWQINEGLLYRRIFSLLKYVVKAKTICGLRYWMNASINTIWAEFMYSQHIYQRIWTISRVSHWYIQVTRA